MRNISFFLLLFMLMFSACAQHSVKHLSRQPWMGGIAQTLIMKYWTFDYMTLSGPDNLFQIAGSAYPKKKNIPGWGRWLKSLTLSVYLCDDKGNVLASQRQTVPGQSIPYDKGVPFSFHLNQKQLSQTRPLFVTFGYQMEIVKNRNSQRGKFDSDLTGEHDEIFFASQGSMMN